MKASPTSIADLVRDHDAPKRLCAGDNAPIRIVLADDHEIMRSGLRIALQRHEPFRVVAEASDGCEAVQRVEEHLPDVIIMDIAMPKINGIEATRQITTKNPGTRVLVLSMHSDEAYVLRALKAGARGYLLKDSVEADLITAVRAVRAGKTFFSPEIGRMLADDYLRQLDRRGVEDSYDLLTAREREIFQLLAEGHGSKEIAELLDLSVYTIETHRGNILQKLGLHNIPELMLYAIRKRIISCA